MSARKFLIASLAAAGFSANASGNDYGYKNLDLRYNTQNQADAVKLFKQDHVYTLAGHRSHSSHSSHSSHRSSSGGGYYSPPAPFYSPPPPPPPPPKAKAISPPPASSFMGNYGSGLPNLSPPAAQMEQGAGTNLQPLSPNTELFTTIVRRVQLGLTAYGYYSGTVDGIVGPQTREAITKMQTDYGLKVTGTITPELLDALNISAR